MLGRFLLRTSGLVFVAVLALGCEQKLGDAEEGARCIRSIECRAGLACVNGACSSDLTALLEAGVVPQLFDASAAVDGEVAPDAGGVVPAADAGTLPMGMDAGVAPRPDAGGPSGTDAGAIPMPDAFVAPMPDAFVAPAPDAGTLDLSDAGGDAPDAGP